MEEIYCFLCQEPKSEVGHTTETCPKATCRTCGQKGHTVRRCPNLNSKAHENPKRLHLDKQNCSKANDKGDD